MTKHTAIDGLSNLIAAFAVGTTQHDASVEWSREALGVLAKDDCLALANLILNATYMTQPKDGHVRADREALRQPLKQFIKEREK